MNLDEAKAKIASLEKQLIEESAKRIEAEELKTLAMKHFGDEEKIAHAAEERADKAERNLEAAHTRNYQDQDEASAIAASLQKRADEAETRIAELENVKATLVNGMNAQTAHIAELHAFDWPNCSGEWISGSGGMRIHNACNHLATWWHPSDMYAYCEAHIVEHEKKRYWHASTWRDQIDQLVECAEKTERELAKRELAEGKIKWEGPSYNKELQERNDKATTRIAELETEEKDWARAIERQAAADKRIAELISAMRRLIGWMAGPTCSDCDPEWCCQTATHENGCTAVIDINKAMAVIGWGPEHAEEISKVRQAEARGVLKARVKLAEDLTENAQARCAKLISQVVELQAKNKQLELDLTNTCGSAAIDRERAAWLEAALEHASKTAETCICDAVSRMPPLKCILHCPNCNTQHIDEGEWETRLHKTHQCQACKHEWRPYSCPTVGVATID